MWDLIVSVPDHCLTFYLVFFPNTVIVILVNGFVLSDSNSMRLRKN